MLTVFEVVFMAVSGFVLGGIGFALLYRLFTVWTKKPVRPLSPLLMFLIVMTVSIATGALEALLARQIGRQLLWPLPFSLIREVSFATGFGLGASLSTWFWRRARRDSSG